MQHFYRAEEGVEAAALVAQFPVEPLTRLAAGFENLSNFNRRFREHYACSPRSYRTRIAAEAGEQ